jgi:tRNA(fMet)-specific endonuclease VapC
VKGYLLDTNVLSELLRKRPMAVVAARLEGKSASELYTSVTCVMELRFGAARHPDGRVLWGRIVRELLPRVQALPIDTLVATRAGGMLAALEAAGTPIGTEDVLIAATAMVHGLTVVTRNLRHFRRVDGLIVESWWE